MKYQFMIDQSMSVAVFSPNGWVPGRCCLPVVNEQNGEKRHWVSVLEVDDGELLFGFLLESLMHEGIPIRLIGQVLVVETEAQVKSTQKKLREIMHIRELSSRWRDKILNLKSSAPSSKVLPPIKWCCDIADLLHQVRRRRVALNVVEGALGDMLRKAIGDASEMAHVATWKGSESEVVDKEKLKTEYPEVWDQVKRTKIIRALRVTR